MEKDSITAALGLKEDWFKEAIEKVEKALDEEDTVSSAIERVADQIKVEEFGEGDYQLTAYEKKLVLAGLHMGTILVQARGQEAMESVIHAILKRRSSL